MDPRAPVLHHHAAARFGEGRTPEDECGTSAMRRPTSYDVKRFRGVPNNVDQGRRALKAFYRAGFHARPAQEVREPYG
jgi:hypothetical protein